MEIQKRRKLADEIVEEIKKPVSTKVMPKLVSTGSTLLNLALSGTPDGGFALGTINNIIGDSSAGKSFLLWTMFAEAVYSGKFNDYDLIYDDAEHAMAFDLTKLFGEEVENKVRIDIKSNTVEDFHDNILKELGAKKTSKNIIYGLDSLDALTSDDETERDIRKGSYRMEKPKMTSEIMRKIVSKLDNTESLAVIISQTRDNIGVTFGSKKTRSGGRALKFYCTHELWLAVENHIKRLERDVGVNVIANVSKNKLTGRQAKVKFPILFDYGIDDQTSCVNFLLDEGVWTKSKKEDKEKTKREIIKEASEDEEKKEKNMFVDTKGFIEERLKLDQLINFIEDNNLMDKLKKLVAETWYKIEEEISTKRPPKYGR